MCSGLDADANLSTIDMLASSAVQSGAHYLQVPEMAVVFAESPDQLRANCFPFEENPHLDRARYIARDHRIWLHVGSMAILLPGERFMNRSILIDPTGQINSFYDKVHLFDADVPGAQAYRESATYDRGQQLMVADVQLGDQISGLQTLGLGLSVCFDVRFGEQYAALAQLGANVLCVPAAFTQPTGEAHWDVLLRARAIETGSFVLAAAQAGQHANGRATHGHSMIVGPWGEVLAQKTDRDVGLVVADLDLTQVDDARRRLPVAAIRNKLDATDAD